MNEESRESASDTYEVIFRLPTGQEWTTHVEHGASLLDAARQCEAPVHTLCNGIGACIQCKIRVVKNTAALSDPNDLEKDRIGNVFHITGERLGCQALVYGDTVIEPLPVRLPKKRRRTSTPPRPR